MVEAERTEQVDHWIQALATAVHEAIGTG